MKRILSILLLTIIMGLSFMTPVLAKDQYIYIDEHEEFDVTSSEIEEFERIAEEYEDEYGIAPYVYLKDDTNESDDYRGAYDACLELYEDHATNEDAIVFAITPSTGSFEYYIYFFGEAAELFSDSDVDSLWEKATANVSTYGDIIRNYYQALNAKTALYTSTDITQGKYLVIEECDEFDLSVSSINEIESKAQAIVNRYGVAPYVYLRNDIGLAQEEQGTYYACNLLYNNIPETEAIIFAMTPSQGTNEYYITFHGKIAQFFTEDDVDAIWNEAATNVHSYDEVIINYLDVIAQRLEGLINSSIPEHRQVPRLLDDADILSNAEEAEIRMLLDEVSETYQMDICVYTVNSLPEGVSHVEYADDYYDYRGLGYGEGDDGLLLLVTMDPRYIYITTYGKAIDVMTDVNIDSTIDAIVDEGFADGDYADGIKAYVRKVERYINLYNNPGDPTDPIIPEKPKSLGERIANSSIFGILGGLISGLLSALGLRGKMKSVHRQVNANRYYSADSLDVTGGRDVFLYRSVSRTPRPKSSSSSSSGSSGGGHSSTHTSSSGRSHGGGGRSF
ncbi:MAG: TPM domain-containing protein [Erysipelotrichaceae bacterium]|nr:TPM domain-containing protein [Erysipelotrichaceae bacterium]